MILGWVPNTFCASSSLSSLHPLSFCEHLRGSLHLPWNTLKGEAIKESAEFSTSLSSRLYMISLSLSLSSQFYMISFFTDTVLLLFRLGLHETPVLNASFPFQGSQDDSLQANEVAVWDARRRERQLVVSHQNRTWGSYSSLKQTRLPPSKPSITECL